jgi:hypothetical protein
MWHPNRTQWTVIWIAALVALFLWTVDVGKALDRYRLSKRVAEASQKHRKSLAEIEELASKPGSYLYERILRRTMQEMERDGDESFYDYMKRHYYRMEEIREEEVERELRQQEPTKPQSFLSCLMEQVRSERLPVGLVVIGGLLVWQLVEPTRKKAAGISAVKQTKEDQSPIPPQPQDKEYIFCPSCQRRNPVDARFCNICGTPTRATIECPSCGVELSGDSRFCSSCGEAVSLVKG